MNNEEHIVIGSNRVITVPPSLKRIAVQHDHNIETVTFDCPRYWDGRDLSTMKAFINYMRSDGHIGSYIVGDITIDETDSKIIHFDWVLSGNVTSVKGGVAFLVNFKITDEEGNPIQQWSSELNRELYVSEGMDTIINRYPDMVTQLLVRMEYLESIISHDSIQRFVDEFMLNMDPTNPEAMQGYVDRYLEANDIHTNRDVLDGITAERVNKWDGYEAIVNKNKDDISSNKTRIIDLETGMNGIQFRIDKGKLQFRYDTEVWQ